MNTLIESLQSTISIFVQILVTVFFVFIIRKGYFQKYVWDLNYHNVIRPKLWITFACLFMPAAYVLVAISELWGKSFPEIIFARTFNEPNNWHVLTGFCLIGLFYYLCFVNRKDPYWLGKSILTVLSLGIFCEFLWNLFYFSNIYSSIDVSSIGSFYLGMVWDAYVIFLGYSFLGKQFLKGLEVVTPALLVYFGIWDLSGFHVSLSVAQNPFYTIYQYDLTTNLIEVGQWVLLSVVVGLTYTFVVGKRVWSAFLIEEL